MFKKYTDIIYEGHYDNPIRITFENAFITLTGEGGNRHIIVGDKDGYIDLWIDTHCYGVCFAFLGSPIIVKKTPSALLVNRVWNLINQSTTKDNLLNKWTKNGLNEFFESLYISAKNGFYF